MSRINHRVRPLRRRLSEQLEQRVLFDADVGALAAVSAEESNALDVALEPPSDREPEVQTLSKENTPPARSQEERMQSVRQFAFVDTTVNGFEELLSDLDPGLDSLQIVYLDPARDGIEQMAEALEGQSDISAIHVVSHGQDATLFLGHQQLRSGDLPFYISELEAIGNALADDADLLLYGCDLAGSADGELLLAKLSELTGADVAASNDTTGNAGLGGNWDLEVHHGLIETGELWVTHIGSTWSGTLAPTPTVTMGLPTEAFVNEAFNFDVTFLNTSSTPSDAGFSPYIDLQVPSGVRINSAEIYGQALAPTIAGTYNGSGLLVDGGGSPIAHPITGLAATGDPGDSLLIYQLPFGSFVPGQPDATINFNAELNAADGAVVGTPLDLSAIGFFALGSDPTDNPAVDPPIVGATATQSITPTVLNLGKTSDVSEAERSTGPNYPITFTLALDIATGETIDNLVVEDDLPDSFVFVPGTVTYSGPGLNSVVVPASGGPFNSPDNRLVFNLGSVTGSGGTDATITYQAYISEFDADGNAVINASSGNAVSTTNDAVASGNYSGSPITDDDAGTDVEISQQSISLQKSVAIVNDLGATGSTPGDTLEYTLSLQVSDFFEFSQLVIDDNFSDGQLWDSTFTPTFLIDEEGVVTAGAFNNSQYTVTHNVPGDGTTDVQFSLSSVIPDGVLTGDLFDDATLDGATTVELRFRTVIQEDFVSNFPSGDRSVDTGDPITNSVTVTGRVNDGLTNSQFESDQSGTSVSIVGPSISKSVYAIGGDTGRSGDAIVAGHTITYRITFPMPTADYENLVITDFLPLPIYDASEIIAFQPGGPSSTPPPAGSFSYGPSHSLNAVAPGTDPPAFTTDAATNSVEFNFGNFDVVNSNAETIDILFTVTAQDMRFDDGLLLTNQANARYGLTTTESRSSNSIAQNEVAAPELEITKGLVSTNGDTPSFSAPIGPTTFLAPGIPGKPFAGTITSADLASTHIDADLRNIDGRDLVKVAITVENTGSADGFNLNVVDSLPPEFQVPSSGLNLEVYRGDGTPLSFVGDIFTTGIEITDPTTNTGAINDRVEGAADGTNIIVITYDVELRDSVEINQSYVATASVTEYGTIDGGANHAIGLPADDLADDASITVQNIAAGKTIDSTSESHTAFLSGSERVSVGEIVRYQLAIEIPEGTLPDVVINERLRSGMQFIDDGTATIALISDSGISSIDGSAGLTVGLGSAANVIGSTIVAPTYVLPDQNVGSTSSLTSDVDSYGNGTNPQFKLGTIVNQDNDANSEYIVIEFNALVLNRSSVNQNSLIRNDYQLSINPSNTGGRSTLRTSNQANVRVVEPRITNLAIGVSQPNADAGDTVTFTVTFSNGNSTRESDAFDANLSNLLPSGYTLDTGSITIVTSSGFGTITDNSAGNLVDIDFAQIPKGGSATVTFNATLGLAVQPGEVLTTPASLTYSSLPGTGTASNPTGSTTPGAPGTLTGERTASGGVNDHLDTSSVGLTVFRPLLSKSLVGTSVANANNLLGEATIGETATYELLLTIPEGTTLAAEAIDDLPTGTTFLSLDQVTFDPSISTDLVGAVSPSISGQEVRFDLGNLLNSADDGAAETILLRYTVRVDNVAGNQGDGPGNILSNGGRLTWELAGATQATAVDSVDISVIEPDLELTYVASPDPIDAGDVVTFDLVVQHSSNSDTDAYDVTLAEVLPLEVGNVTLVSAIHSSLGDLSSQFSYAAATNTIATNTPLGFDLAFGETLTLRVTGNVNQTVNPAETLTANSEVRWTSLDGLSANERDGAGGIDDYESTETTSVTVVRPTISKDLLTTSVVDGNNASDEVVIGELVQYRIRVELPESTIDNSRVIDTLDPGLEFVSLDSVSVTSGVLPTVLVTSNVGPITDALLFVPSVTGTVVSGQTATFDFGQIVNADTSNSDIETLELVYTARVANIEGTQRNATLGNDVTFSWTRGVIPETTPPDSAADVTVLEPTLEITHDLNSNSGDAFDSLIYTSTIAHSTSSNADAYDGTYAAGLPGLFNVSTFMVSHSSLGDVTGLFELAAGNTLRTRTGQSFDLAISESITISAAGTTDSAVMPTDVLASNAQVLWSSIDGTVLDERDGSGGPPTTGSTPLNNYAATDSESFTIDPLAFSKRLLSTSVTDATNGLTDVVIGELATYQLIVTVPEGQASSLLITDVMDQGLEFVSLDSVLLSSGLSSNSTDYSPIISGDGITTPQRMIFDLGDLTNGNTDNSTPEIISLTYTARVMNIASNQSNGVTGTILDEAAFLSYDDRGSLVTLPTVSAQNLGVIEPVLDLGFSVSDSTPHLGQIVRFTATIDHDSTSNATAHDLTFVNALPSGAILESVSANGVSIVADTSNSGNVNLRLGSLPVSGTATIEYDVRITDDLSFIGSTLQHDPRIEWTSLPDGLSSGLNAERDGDGGSLGEDDYAAINGATLSVVHPLTEITQSTVAVTPAASGISGNFDITYDITVTATGNDPLEQVTIQEDFSSLFGGGFIGISAGPVVTTTNADDPIELSGTYDGTSANSQLIDNTGGNTNRFLPGQFATIRMTVEVDPDASGANLTSGEFVSQALAEATGVSSMFSASDLSDDPANAANIENDSPSDSEPDDPNRHRFPFLSTTKSIVGSPLPAASGNVGNFDVTYQIVIENDGSTPIERLALTEDFQGQFGNSFVGLVAAPTLVSTAVDPPGMSPSYSGLTSNAQLFDASSSRLEINETVTVTMVVEIDPDAAGGLRDATTGGLANQALVSGFDPASPTIAITDLSDDPSDSTQFDANSDNDPDDPTRLLIPEITVTKEFIGSVVPAASGTYGNFDVTFQFELTNTGNEPLRDLALEQNFLADYGTAFVGLVGAPSILGTSTASNLPQIDATYSGLSANDELFDQSGAFSDRLNAGENVVVQLTIEIDPDAAGATTSGGFLISQSTVTATGIVGSTVVDDLSDDPGDPADFDSESDGEPDDPNRLRVPLISATQQQVGTPVPASSGTQGNFDVTFQIRVDNDGTTPLDALSLSADLGSMLGDAFVGLPVTPSVTGGNATVPPSIDASYSGQSGFTELFDPTSPSQIDPGQFVVISLVAEIDPDAPGRLVDSLRADGDGDFETQVIAAGTDPISAIRVSDTSDDPTDPLDVDGDPSDPTNATDDNNDPDDPTTFWLPSVTLTKTQVGSITPASSGTAGNFEVVYDLQVTNNGNEPLESVSVLEDLLSHFGGSFVRVVPQAGNVATLVASNATDAPELNTGFTGTPAGSTDLVSNASGNTNRLDPEQTFTIRLVVEFDADAPGGNRIAGNFITSADVFGTGNSSGSVVTDRSDDPLAILGIDINSDNDPDDPNSIRVPDITLTKAVSQPPRPAISGVVGNYDVDYQFVVTNTGTTNLQDIVIRDDWAAQFGGAFIGIFPGSISVTDINTGSAPLANGSYSGGGGESLIVGAASFDPGQSFRIDLTAEIDPNAPGAIRQIGQLINQATVTANDPLAPTVVVSDRSDDPNNPADVDGDPSSVADNDNNPDDPTAFGYSDIGLAKRIVSATRSATTPGAMTLTYELVVRNVGSSDLSDLTLSDDLASSFGSAFTGVVLSPQIVSSSAASNPNLLPGYDGNLLGSGNVEIFDGSSGLLRPGEEITLQFAIDIHPDLLTPALTNQALASGHDGTEFVNDRSDSGEDPESTNPGQQNDSGGEDDATPIPGLSIVKSHGNASRSPADYSAWVLPIRLAVENTGSSELSQLRLDEDLSQQFGSGFLSATAPLFESVSVSSGDLPLINPSWRLDTSQNLLSGGTLSPGDSFVITLEVLIDPDRFDPATLAENQATISGADTVNPAIVIFDESDSGLSLGYNPNQPGDTGGSDDPTPLRIAELGVAKQVTNVETVGLTSELTVRIVIQNTGTVHLGELNLFDDLAVEFGDNYGGIASAPRIVSTTATIDPNLALSFANDTSANLFDGASGLLAPGEQVVIEMDVLVVATSGQAEVVLMNQALALGTPMDAGGANLIDSGGAPLPAVADRSDSGALASTSNPGALGDSGGFNDPTPTAITFFTFDSLNNLSEPFDVVRPGHWDYDWPGNRMLSRLIPSLAPDPVFSGAARPGTKIIARIFDSKGFEIGTETSYADVGGNWLMQVHNLERQDYVRVEFEEVAGSIGRFSPSGDSYGYLGLDRTQSDYQALEPWALYDHRYDFNAVYQGSARVSLTMEHARANRPIGFGN